MLGVEERGGDSEAGGGYRIEVCEDREFELEREGTEW